MREIKFRFWDMDLKKMCFRHPAKMDFSHPKILPMQYTGIKDKNGLEIYEGDILLWDTDTVVKVEFKDGEYRGFQLSGPVPGNLHCYHFYRSEIIGNIHENPDLL